MRLSDERSQAGNTDGKNPEAKDVASDAEKAVKTKKRLGMMGTVTAAAALAMTGCGSSDGGKRLLDTGGSKGSPVAGKAEEPKEKGRASESRVDILPYEDVVKLEGGKLKIFVSGILMQKGEMKILTTTDGRGKQFTWQLDGKDVKGPLSETVGIDMALTVSRDPKGPIVAQDGFGNTYTHVRLPKGGVESGPVKEGKKSAPTKETEKKIPIPPEVQKLFNGKDIEVLRGLRVFALQGGVYFVDPSDPKGNCLFQLKQGDTIALGKILARANASALAPYEETTDIYAEIKGKERIITHLIPCLPDGTFVGQDGRRGGKPFIHPHFTRVWEVVEGVTAADLGSGLKWLQKQINIHSSPKTPPPRLQSSRVIVKSVDKNEPGGRFHDTAGRTWVLQYREEGAVPRIPGEGGVMEVVHIPGRGTYLLYPDGGVWLAGGPPPREGPPPGPPEPRRYARGALP